MSPSTAEGGSRRGAGGEWLLRLGADAWLLATPAGTRRQPLDGAPALQLERLEAEPAGRGARLRVVLGDGWLRYLVLHWPRGVRSGAERRAYAAHRFREVHGVAEPEWSLAVDRDAAVFPALGCAVPAVLVGALQAFAEQRGLKLESVTGDFVACFNERRSGFREPPGGFGALAVAREGRITVGLWRDGAWRTLRSQPLGSNEAWEVLRMLETWSLQAVDDPAEELPVGVLYAAGFEASAPAGWRVEQRGGHPWA